MIGLSWQSSPAVTEIEEVVTDWLRQMLGLSPGVQRRDPGHGLDEHAGRAHLRPRAGDELCAGARRPAGRNAHAARLCVGARPQLGRQGRAARRLRPRQSAPRSVRRPIRHARRRARRNGRRGSRERRPALRDRRHRRHDRNDGDRSDRGHSRDRAAPRNLAACRRRDGGQRDDPARMPLDVGGRRGRGLRL